MRGNWQLRRHNGRLYLCGTGGGFHPKGPAIYRFDPKTQTFVLTVVGNSIINHDKALELSRIRCPLLGRLYEANEKAERWMWADINGDGVPQAEEFQLRPGNWAEAVLK